MRRRREATGVPEHLERFDVADWPGETVADRVAIWKEARKTWAEDHGGWPGGPLAMLAGVSDVRRRMEGLPLLSWGRTAAELERLDGIRRDRSRRRETT